MASTTSIQPTKTNILPSSNPEKTLKDLYNSLPKDVFEKSYFKGFRSIIFSILLMAAGVATIAYLPWYLLPFGWIFIGTVSTRLFSIGNACQRQQFFSSEILNTITAQICLLPMLYPSVSLSNSQRFTSYLSSMVESPFWFMSSVWQWILAHVSCFRQKRTALSNGISVAAFAAAFISLMVYFTGIWGLFKYYLIPMVIFHLWLSTFLKINDASDNISRKKYENSQIFFIECPKWLRYLTHNCNYTLKVELSGNNSLSSLMHLLNDNNDMNQSNFQNSNENNNDNDDENNNINNNNNNNNYQNNKIDDDDEKETNTGHDYACLLESVASKIPSYNLTRAHAEMKRCWGEYIKESSVLSSELIKAILNYTKPANVNWVTSIFLISSPILGITGLFTTPFCWGTYLVAFLKYYLAGIGITAGYHRLYSHRSYDANKYVGYFLIFLGTTCFEGSVLDWCADHRTHHRFTDTPKDPYNARQGFWYSHMGWMLKKRSPEVGTSDVSDLKRDPVIALQHKYYPIWAILSGLILPGFICHFLFDNFAGGILVAGFLSTTVMMHCTFFINSLAHYWGEFTFTDQRTPRDSGLVSLVSFGEGYHNFHHEFPYDYRNGVGVSHYDPGKWLIRALEMVGLAYNVQRMPQEVIEKGRIQMMEKKVKAKRQRFDWGPETNELPEMTFSQFKRSSSFKAKLMIVNDIVYDVSQFNHPGGDIIKAYIGKDASKAFDGGVYNHSHAARNMLAMLAVARLVDDNHNDKEQNHDSFDDQDKVQQYTEKQEKIAAAIEHDPKPAGSNN